MNTLTLSNGLKIPQMAFGTWKNEDPHECIDSVKTAILKGLTHIDCARVYANEHLVGKGIALAGVERKDLFLTSKLRNSAHGYENVRKEVLATLSDLQTDYLDLYLIHWPVVQDHGDTWAKDNLDTWRAFEELYKEGVLRSIGVSNFSIPHLENLLTHAQIKPMVNQILIHPGVLREEDMNFCRKHQILLAGYSPLAPLKTIAQENFFQEICEKYQKTPAQILLRFILDLQAIPLTKSIREARICENMDVFDFSLQGTDMRALLSWSHKDFTIQDNMNERPPQKLDALLK